MVGFISQNMESVLYRRNRLASLTQGRVVGQPWPSVRVDLPSRRAPRNITRKTTPVACSTFRTWAPFGWSRAAKHCGRSRSRTMTEAHNYTAATFVQVTLMVLVMVVVVVFGPGRFHSEGRISSQRTLDGLRLMLGRVSNAQRRANFGPLTPATTGATIFIDPSHELLNVGKCGKRRKRGSRPMRSARKRLIARGYLISAIEKQLGQLAKLGKRIESHSERRAAAGAIHTAALSPTCVSLSLDLGIRNR
ncbi:hypothetical protein B0T26DRAFT_167442 [Lasiosphaeria miniovina]|uniref:Uncharacterized protein n=1 Tax=Lasiosphaeria miniovina TaxID=1954250 RepID=A0AA40B6S5_9PEZI|nr:uncharacterized protein B0T26DRAFT_167442 [Lasiosphaeria miniovina]KAK0728348.1 hypothetical protein B0T26DRAFT_167442 [Lasiosphaeria miniovina]